MNKQEEQMYPFSAPLAEERASGPRSQNAAKRLLWAVLAITVATAVELGGWLWLATRYSVQPLRADANTLYLADWSKDINGWTGGDQWHWKAPGVISSVPDSIPLYSQPQDLFFLAPYHPSADDIEIDAQIKSLDWGNTFVGEGPIYGIVMGMDSQYMGYSCSEVPRFLGHVDDWTDQGITGYAGIDDAHLNFADYVNFTLKIQHHVVTLYLNGQQTAQATLPAYQTGGAVGVYSLYGTIEVEGFRVEKLP